VGGYFKSSLDKDLNNPPTAVGGIRSHNELGIREYPNESTHYRGWDFEEF
jgi:hypothetical protein